MCFNHGWKGAISDRRRKWGIFLRSRYTAFSVPIFFDRAIRSAHTVEKVDFFSGMRGSDCSIEKLFEAHRTSHHRRKHTITPYNSSDAGLTAAAAAAATHSESAWRILFSARQQRVPSFDGSSACYRLPFCNTAAAAVLALATLNESQRQNRDDEGDEGSPRAKRTLCSRKRHDRDLCLSTASSSTQADPLEHAGRTRKQLSTDFRLLYSRVSNPPRKSTKTKTKSRSD